MVLSHAILGSILFCCCLFTSCGRKQKNIFNFNEIKNVKINKLSLPAIKGIGCRRTGNYIIITWHPVTHKSLVGYNIYYVPQGLVVKKKPLNKKAIKTNAFSHKVKNHSYYLVRGVFTLHTQTVEGPASQICYCK